MKGQNQNQRVASLYLLIPGISFSVLQKKVPKSVCVFLKYSNPRISRRSCLPLKQVPNRWGRTGEPAANPARRAALPATPWALHPLCQRGLWPFPALGTAPVQHRRELQLADPLKIINPQVGLPPHQKAEPAHKGDELGRREEMSTATWERCLR